MHRNVVKLLDYNMVSFRFRLNVRVRDLGYTRHVRRYMEYRSDRPEVENMHEPLYRSENVSLILSVVRHTCLSRDFGVF